MAAGMTIMQPPNRGSFMMFGPRVVQDAISKDETARPSEANLQGAILTPHVDVDVEAVDRASTCRPPHPPRASLT